MEKHYSLHRKKPGRAYQATFCFLGETEPFGTSERNWNKADDKCQKVQPKMLQLLARRAAEKHKSVPPEYLEPSAGSPAAEGNPGTPNESPSEKLPPLNLKEPAPKGSLRQHIEADVKFVLKNKPSEHAKRDAKDAAKHIFKGLGGYVDLDITKMDGAMGDRLAAYFNNPVLFRLSGEKGASLTRRLLTPMLAVGLPREFIAALDRVKKQCDDDDASDPFRADHYRRLYRRLQTGLEADFLLGLFLLGCHPAPQIIDALLLQWEGVDFGTGMVKLYREKTKIIAEFKMSKQLRAWLDRRHQEAPPDAVYVFWELVWPKDERGKPGFNQTVITDNKRIGSISSNSGTVWREFMHRAGIPVDLMTLSPGDITDFKGFIERLRLKADPKYSWLFKRLSRVCQKALLAAPSTQEELEYLENLVRGNINRRIIQGEFAYDEEFFKDKVVLRGQTRELLNPEFKGVRLHKFHRLFLEDLFPELKRVQFSSYNYSYSSFRKGLVSFLRGVGIRDRVIAANLGQDALDSQQAYDRVAEHEFTRSSEITEGHVEAMIEGREEFYPSTPYDSFVKMLELFGVQEQAQLRLLEEFRRLQQEAEQNAQRRHKEVLKAVQQGEHETQGVLALRLEAMEERMHDRFMAIEARLSAQEMGQQLIRAIPYTMPAGTRALLIACIRLVLLAMFLMVSAGRSSSTPIRLAAPVLRLGPPRNAEEDGPDFQI